jgi:hypothetical protein
VKVSAPKNKPGIVTHNAACYMPRVLTLEKAHFGSLTLVCNKFCVA